MKYLSKSFLCAAFVLVMGFGAFAQSVPDPDRSGILYEISGNGLTKPSYVFGTVHLVCNTDMLDIKQIMNYAGKTEQAVMELDLDDLSQLLGGVATPPKAEPTALDKLYTKEELAVLDAATKKYLSVPIQMLNSINPALIQFMFIGSPKMLGCSEIGSYDLQLASEFKALKLPIEGLETVEEQMSIVTENLDGKTPKENLWAFVSNLENYSADIKKLVAIHKTQDLSALILETKAQMKDRAEFEASFLTKRNGLWIPKLEKFFGEKSTFVAVGAAHLGGGNGILDLLEEKGYKVRAIRIETKDAAATPAPSKNK